MRVRVMNMKKMVSKKALAILIGVGSVAVFAFQNCAQPQISVADKLETSQSLKSDLQEEGSQVNPYDTVRDNTTFIGPQKILIQSGALFTNDDSVQISLEADGAQEMLLTDEPDCATATNWEKFVPQKAWKLKQPNDVNSVFVKFRKHGAPETSCLQASILHDDQPPKASLADVPEFLNITKVMVDVGADDGQTGSGVLDIFCQLDKLSENRCQDFFEVQGLEEGKHTLGVRARDKAGNISETNFRTFIVDRVPPKIVLSGPTGSIAQSEVKLHLSILESNQVAEVNCKLTPLQSDFMPCGAGILEYKDLTAGAYHFFVKAKDGAGNISESELMFEIDLTVPSVQITKSPADVINATQATFEFSGFNADKKIEKFFCSLDGQPIADCKSPHTVTLFGDKEYSFLVQAENELQVRSGAVVRKFVRDSKSPAIQVSKAPLPMESGPSVDILLSATDNISIAKVVCYMDQQPMDCSAQRVSYHLQDGEHKFQALAIDTAGNQTWTTPISFQVDSRPESKIDIIFSSLIVDEGRKTNFSVAAESVENISYLCTTVHGGIVVARGQIDPLSIVKPELIVNTEIECRVTGSGKFGLPIAKSARVQVNCGNKLVENGKCVDFKCNEYKLIFPTVSAIGTTSNLKVPARSALGTCYIAKLFDSIPYSNSSLNEGRDEDVKARTHGDSTTKFGHPWVMNKALIDFVVGGPRIVKLAGGPNAEAPIKADNFLLAGIKPVGAEYNIKQYKSYGTADSAIIGTEYIYLKNEAVRLIPFGNSGTATVAPLVIASEVDSMLMQQLDLRMLDCGGSREQSEIYLLFQ